MLDLLCFSHLRWDFVFQRPQHLMTRFARERRVFYIEEPVSGSGPARLVVTHRGKACTLQYRTSQPESARRIYPNSSNVW